MSKIVSIDQIEEGMINLDPVVNKFGQTLLPSGVKLTSSHVMILKTWNIRSLTVRDENETETDEISEELRILIKQQIKKRMKWTPRNEIEKDLINAAIKIIGKNYYRANQEK